MDVIRHLAQRQDTDAMLERIYAEVSKIDQMVAVRVFIVSFKSSMKVTLNRKKTNRSKRKPPAGPTRAVKYKLLRMRKKQIDLHHFRCRSIQLSLIINVLHFTGLSCHREGFTARPEPQVPGDHPGGRNPDPAGRNRDLRPAGHTGVPEDRPGRSCSGTGRSARG